MLLYLVTACRFFFKERRVVEQVPQRTLALGNQKGEQARLTPYIQAGQLLWPVMELSRCPSDKQTFRRTF